MPDPRLKPKAEPDDWETVSTPDPGDWENVTDWETARQPPARKGFLGAFIENVNPMPLVRDVGSAMAPGVPGKEARERLMSIPGNIAQNTSEQLSQSGNALLKGNVSKAAFHLAGAVPMVGPMAQQVGQDVAEGQYPEAAGHAAGIAAGIAAPKIPGAVRSGVKNITNAARLNFGTPESLMTRALKPRSANTDFQAQLKRSMPELKASEAQTGVQIADLETLHQNLKDAKQRVWKQRDAIFGPARAMNAQIDLTPMADAMVASIPEKIALENPKLVARIQATADKYRGKFPVQKVEELLHTANAQLDNFYAKYPPGQRATTAGDPLAASLEAQGKGLRKALYEFIDQPGSGEAAREVNRRYGSLMNLEEEIYRRKNVADRQQPNSLSEQIGKWEAAGQAAKGLAKGVTGNFPGAAADLASALAKRKMATWLKEQATSNAMVGRAFKGFNGMPTEIPFEPPRQPAGLLGPGAIITPPPAGSVGPGGSYGVPPNPSPVGTAKALDAKPIIAIDPLTGKPTIVFTTNPAEYGGMTEFLQKGTGPRSQMTPADIPVDIPRNVNKPGAITPIGVPWQLEQFMRSKRGRP